MPSHAFAAPAAHPAEQQEWRAVAEQLARDVQAGLLPPGACLKQVDPETRYGCGRSDVRRALDELVRGGCPPPWSTNGPRAAGSANRFATMRRC